jgi:hypothetical protein
MGADRILHLQKREDDYGEEGEEESEQEEGRSGAQEKENDESGGEENGQESDKEGCAEAQGSGEKGARSDAGTGACSVLAASHGVRNGDRRNQLTTLRRWPQTAAW